jgi:hypothetical protein
MAKKIRLSQEEEIIRILKKEGASKGSVIIRNGAAFFREFKKSIII